MENEIEKLGFNKVGLALNACCLSWIVAKIGDGYGCMNFGGMRYGAHRLASMLLVNQSPIPLTG